MGEFVVVKAQPNGFLEVLGQCDLPPFAIPLISWKSSLRLI